MIRIETQTHSFQDMHEALPEQYTKLPNGIAATLRVHHLLTNVIDPLVASRTSVQFHGELEAFVLQPLLTLAALVLDTKQFAKQKPGFVLADAQRHGTAYALAAEALTVAQSKNMFDAVSKKVMDVSPIIKALQAHSKTKTKPEDVEKGIYDIMGSLNSVFASDSVYQSVYETIQSSDTAEKATAFADQLILLGGTGPGLPLPITVLPARTASMMQIAQAIRLMANPSLTGANAESVRTAQDFESDAYAMAVMFAMYLHHSQSADTYNIAFAGTPPTADAKSRMPLAVQSARRLAWMYSGVATAPQAFDYLLVRRLLGNVASFMAPALVSSASQVMDIESDLKIIDDVLSRSIPAPISAHEDWVWKVISKLAGDKLLLPENFINGVLPAWPTIPKELYPGKGWDAIVWETFSASQVPTSDLQAIARNLASLVHLLRVNSQSLSTRVNSFLIHNQFDPNTLNVPNSLFSSEDILSRVSPLSTNSYFNPWDPAPYSAPMRRFNPRRDKSGAILDYDWIGTDKTYAPLCLPQLRVAEQLKTAIQFRPTAPLPVKMSIGKKFALAAVPRQYVAESITGSLKNEFSAVAQALRAQSVGLSGAFTYFQDAASICAFGSAEQRTSMVWALSAMFQIYVKEIDSHDELKSFKPTESLACTLKDGFPLPYIYGVPTMVFMSKQNQPTQERSRSFKVKGLGKEMVVWFVLHSHAMPISTYSAYQTPITHGVFITIPVSDAYANAISETLREISSRTQEEEDVTATEDIYRKLQITDELKLNSGEKIVATPISEWAATLMEYPHVAFQHFQPVTFTLNLTASDVMAWAHTIVRRMVVKGSSDMLVQAHIPDNYVMFEAKDAHTTQLYFDGGDHNVDAITDANPVDAPKPATTSGQQPSAGAIVKPEDTVDAAHSQTEAPASSGEIAKLAISSLADTIASSASNPSPVVPGKKKTADFRNSPDAADTDGRAVGDVDANLPELSAKDMETMTPEQIDAYNRRRGKGKGNTHQVADGEFNGNM